MERIELKMICDKIESNQTSSSARFLIPGPMQTIAPPGVPQRRIVRTVMMITFDNPATAKQYDSGKEYSITIGE